MPYPSSRKHAAARYNEFARHEQGGHDRVRRWSDHHITWLREAHSRYPGNDTKVVEAIDNTAAQLLDLSDLEHLSRERTQTLRRELQKRYDEETTLLSWIKLDPGRAAKQLPREICETIAGLNNRTAKWDTPLAPAKIYPDKTRPRPIKRRHPAD